MIIWRGWGVFVIVIIFASSLSANMIALSLGEKAYWETHAWPFACSLIVSGIIIWFVAAHLSRREPRVLVDEKTGQRVSIDPQPTFFFIPMKWWGPISAGIGLVLLAANGAPGK